MRAGSLKSPACRLLEPVHGEMLKLGIEVSQATVRRHMVRRHGPPSPTWWTFLRHQLHP